MMFLILQIYNDGFIYCSVSQIHINPEKTQKSSKSLFVKYLIWMGMWHVTHCDPTLK